jgi:hypothetical protein
MNQIIKNYIKIKLEKKVGQCGGIQGRQDHTKRVKQYCRREKKHNTSLLCVSLCMQAFPMSLCVYVETDMRKNGKWKLGFWGRNECE